MNSLKLFDLGDVSAVTKGASQLQFREAGKNTCSGFNTTNTDTGVQCN